VHGVSEIANQLPTDTETLHALVMTAWMQRDRRQAVCTFAEVDRLGRDQNPRTAR
jgi:hypothetical protein